MSQCLKCNKIHPQKDTLQHCDACNDYIEGRNDMEWYKGGFIHQSCRQLWNDRLVEKRQSEEILMNNCCEEFRNTIQAYQFDPWESSYQDWWKYCPYCGEKIG